MFLACSLLFPGWYLEWYLGAQEGFQPVYRRTLHRTVAVGVDRHEDVELFMAGDVLRRPRSALGSAGVVMRVSRMAGMYFNFAGHTVS